MRLLNVKTFQLSEFFEEHIPPYVILSHRWSKNEASYHDFIQQGYMADTDGSRKIRELCHFVRNRGIIPYLHGIRLIGREALQWVWIDTICIDKTSSSELSEAINSMYNWYSNAWECYVYMPDVPSFAEATPNQVLEAFEQSTWFTRGWTLQELCVTR
jgi:hypothetical protein